MQGRRKDAELEATACCKITTATDKDALIVPKEIVNEEKSNKVAARSMVAEFL